jgi:hypothetical protein
VATLDAAETEIDRVDGKMAPVEAETLEVLPGVHSVTVGARSYRRFIIHGQLVNARQAQTVCFRAAAGGAYWTAPVINEKERRWYPVVIDSKTRISVTVPCPGGNER